MYTRKNIWENIQRPQPENGQIPTYYIFDTVTKYRWTATVVVPRRVPLRH